jgi:hypothetical protein
MTERCLSAQTTSKPLLSFAMIVRFAAHFITPFKASGVSRVAGLHYSLKTRSIKHSTWWYVPKHTQNHRGNHEMSWTLSLLSNRYQEAHMYKKRPSGLYMSCISKHTYLTTRNHFKIRSMSRSHMYKKRPSGLYMSCISKHTYLTTRNHFKIRSMSRSVSSPLNQMITNQSYDSAFYGTLCPHYSSTLCGNLMPGSSLSLRPSHVPQTFAPHCGRLEKCSVWKLIPTMTHAVSSNLRVLA